MDGIIDNLKPGRSEDDLVYEILLKMGYPLTADLAAMEIDGLTVYTVEHSGRLRKFYRITPGGVGVIDQFLASWPEIQRVYQLIKECAGDDTCAVSE